jgi:hypothetical protein
MDSSTFSHLTRGHDLMDGSLSSAIDHEISDIITRHRSRCWKAGTTFGRVACLWKLRPDGVRFLRQREPSLWNAFIRFIGSRSPRLCVKVPLSFSVQETLEDDGRRRRDVPTSDRARGARPSKLREVGVAH